MLISPGTLLAGDPSVAAPPPQPDTTSEAATSSGMSARAPIG
jgi:hypothetical protein